MAFSGNFDYASAPVDRPVGVDDPRTNLIVNYLPQSFSDEEFYSLFGQIGPIVNAKIARDIATGKMENCLLKLYDMMIKIFQAIPLAMVSLTTRILGTQLQRLLNTMASRFKTRESKLVTQGK
jgi:hypothetical protein